MFDYFNSNSFVFIGLILLIVSFVGNEIIGSSSKNIIALFAVINLFSILTCILLNKSELLIVFIYMMVRCITELNKYLFIKSPSSSTDEYKSSVDHFIDDEDLISKEIMSKRVSEMAYSSLMAGGVDDFKNDEKHFNQSSSAAILSA